MKFELAQEIGLACGLESPTEWVNNLLIHAFWIRSNDMAREETELIEDAGIHGVLFAKCGHADSEEGNDLCYMCRRLQKD